MPKCKRYYIDDCGQGFTAPCCALLGTIEQNKSWLYNENCLTLKFVSCEGHFEKCDIVNEVKEWNDAVD